MITVDNLQKTVAIADGELTILRGISFEIKPAESVAIVGVSGSGKSTLLGLLAGLDVASDGDVIIDGIALSTLDEDARAALRAEKVGFVFQSFQLLPALTALENVMLPLELAGRASASATARDYLERVALGHRTDHYPTQLSGGEQQRVGLARAFIHNPDILFADEPTGNLDGETGAQIEHLLFDLNEKQGTTLVIVTHDKTLAQKCDRTIELKNGRILSDSSPSNNVPSPVEATVAE